MKRLWPLPILLFLALPLRAQEGEAVPEGEAAAEGAAPMEGEGGAQNNGPSGDGAPLTEPGSAGDPSAQGGAAPNSGEDGGEPAEKPAKEEPLISVKVVAPVVEETDEDSTAPAAPENKVTPTATIMKAPKKGKAAPKKTKQAKAAPTVVKTKAPVLVAEAPPPPVPAVPLTPITPRNP